MFNMNEMMEMILKDRESQTCSLQVEAIVNKIVNKTKKIKDCIIYDRDGTLEEEKINFNRIEKMVGDWTGYEVSCNEFRFNQDVVDAEHYLMLAQKLGYMLNQRYNKKTVIYIILHDNEVELRFHTNRGEEGLWLDKNLNKYNVPILCWI